MLLFSGFHCHHYTCEIGFLWFSFPLRNDGVENLLRCLLAITSSSPENFLLIIVVMMSEFFMSSGY